MCAQEDQCSLEPFLAVLYFCSFMLVCSYILLQLVIGIILDSIQAASSYDFLTVGPVCVCVVCACMRMCLWRTKASAYTP